MSPITIPIYSLLVVDGIPEKGRYTFLKLAVVLTKVQDDLVGNSVIFSYFLQAADQGFPTEMLVDFQKQVDYKVARCISEAIHCHG